MNLKNIPHFFVIIFFSCYGFSQEEQPKKDSTQVTYKKIEDFSKKTKSSKFLHKLVFRISRKPKAKNEESSNQIYKPFEGKIIRNIIVQSYDPFGFSITDSIKKPEKWIEKAGNYLHVKSKDFAIKNLLIFKTNTPLDSLLLIESERLIRSRNYIRSVQVLAQPITKNTDSVDVLIKVLDSWSFIPNVAISSSKMKLRVRERNFLGFGHQVKATIIDRLADDKIAYGLRYTMPSIKNTYISTTLDYNIDLDGFYSKQLNIERPFYSAFAKWAGGIYFDEQYRQDMLPDKNMIFEKQNFKYQSKDIWAGYSFHLFGGNTEKERTTNVISSLRLLHIDYRENPTKTYDSIQFFSNETFFLGSIGLSSRQFIKDRFIFRDGIIENVPIGNTLAVTAGNQYKNKTNKLYLGVEVSHGNYYKWGYLSTSFEYGTFFNQSKTEQSAYAFSANYFTNLIDLGNKWKMRQFIKPQFLIGKNRLNSIGDRVTIDERNNFQSFYGNEENRKNSAGIPGFDSGIMGTKKFMLSTQTQFYPPWEWLGFTFNPYLNVNTAMLSNENTSIGKSKLYSSLGVGFIIRNNYLVFSSFQLSLTYFPSIPNQGNHIFNTNAFESDDFGFQSFELGKPSPIWYN